MKREMDETSEGWSDGWVGGWREGRPVTGVCMSREICNEISVSQTGCYTLILDG